jgi:hypothetical protein
LLSVFGVFVVAFVVVVVFICEHFDFFVFTSSHFWHVLDSCAINNYGWIHWQNDGGAIVT